MIEGHMALAIRNAAELTMSADMQRAAMIRNEPVDLDGLIRVEGVARRAVADIRQLAREVRGEVQPSMTIEEHIRATYTNAGTSGCQRRPRPGPTPPHKARRTANPPGGARHPTTRPTTGGRA
jgi:hypothetical protein